MVRISVHLLLIYELQMSWLGQASLTTYGCRRWLMSMMLELHLTYLVQTSPTETTSPCRVAQGEKPSPVSPQIDKIVAVLPTHAYMMTAC